MIVQCKYYKLKEKKDMQDGHSILANQKLLYICTEEEDIQFITIDDSDIERIFWAKENEVEFIESKGYEIGIFANRVEIITTIEENRVYETDGKTKKEAVFIAVSDFARQFNLYKL